jgi:hypothetical protein
MSESSSKGSHDLVLQQIHAGSLKAVCCALLEVDADQLCALECIESAHYRAKLPELSTVIHLDEK